jgi:pimeloyl-ACP methyl ester carboxylesterase
VSRLRLQLVLGAIFLLAWSQGSRFEPRREKGILPIEPPTPYIYYAPAGPARGRALVIHGLDVSKEVMYFISAALADGGFEVYAIDLPGHGDSPEPFQTDRAEKAVRNAKAYLGDGAIVLGHSLGAGLLLDLSATEHFSTMVLLSPPPLSISEIHADRVLIATGAIDIPRIRVFTPIAADIGAPRVESWILPWAAHSAAIFNPGYVRKVVDWLGGDGQRTRTGARMFWLAAMLSAAVAFGVTLLPARTEGMLSQFPLSPEAVPLVLVRYVAAAGVALIAVKFVNPAAWLRLFATDYLIGFLFVAGLILVAIDGGTSGLSLRPVALLKAGGAAAFVIVAPGLLIASRVLHMMLSDGRWWRFPFIVLMGFPLFLSDEVKIRRNDAGWKSTAVALLTRGLILAFLLTGVLLLNRENAILVMIAPLIVIFWIGLWFASGVVRRHTQDPLASALFAAIVQGWAFAAWFVTI